MRGKVAKMLRGSRFGKDLWRYMNHIERGKFIRNYEISRERKRKLGIVTTRPS